MSQPAASHSYQVSKDSEVLLRSNPSQIKKEAKQVPNHSCVIKWSGVLNQTTVAQPAPSPPTNEVMNTYFISCAIGASSSLSGENN